MSKDQSYGFLIFLVSVVIAVLYLYAFFGPYLGLLDPFWYNVAVGLPVILAVLMALGIMAWIGYTMMTTPPPAPLEEIAPSAETQSEEKKGA